MTAFAPSATTTQPAFGFAILHGSFAPRLRGKAGQGFAPRSAANAVSETLAASTARRASLTMAPTPWRRSRGRIRWCDTLIIRHDDDAPAIDPGRDQPRPVDAALDRVHPSSPTAGRGSTGASSAMSPRRPLPAARSPRPDDDIIHIDHRRARSHVCRSRHAPARKVIRPGKVTLAPGAAKVQPPFAP